MPCFAARAQVFPVSTELDRSFSTRETVLVCSFKMQLDTETRKAPRGELPVTSGCYIYARRNTATRALKSVVLSFGPRSIDTPSSVVLAVAVSHTRSDPNSPLGASVRPVPGLVLVSTHILTLKV